MWYKPSNRFYLHLVTIHILIIIFQKVLKYIFQGKNDFTSIPLQNIINYS